MSCRFLPGILLSLLLLPSAAVASDTTAAATTRVIVLGVDHSTQLVARGDQPAALEAFLDRAKPDAICVERTPEAFARNDFYEFTYEVQSVVLPYARRTGIELCPVDWEPPRDDQLLGFGIDLEAIPEARPAQGFHQFLSFPQSATLQRGLLHAENPDNVAKVTQWAAQPAAKSADDLPRRLYLYRTFMQAKRLVQAAKARPGGTVVLVVGEFHKRDIEAILASDPAIVLVPPSAIGEPSADEVRRHQRREYRLAVATFNLLGVQAKTGTVDFAWLREEITQLQKENDTPEVQLLATRLDLLEGRIDARQAIARYERIARVDGDPPFTWNGVKDRARVDSYFDPFGNLDVRRRALVESAREWYRSGKPAKGDALLAPVVDGLTARQRAQVETYWRREFAT
ncbi:hypothetical protein DFR29_12617 [Tahibacter aquaticus]|uniref:Iron-regulated protein n=1 Tax=Tahibacter aquaticus TaxID=520092 RepID=A0A4R6YJD9_9GAMM|nr:hypothetical protein [Tahibacter aquaticus]TDR36981.1 hypothetical protein DFR29_12617 [Tahibacter aquaticus]